MVRDGFERGLALMFTLAGLLGVAVTAVAWRSRSYRALTTEGSSAPEPEEAPADAAGPGVADDIMPSAPP